MVDDGLWWQGRLFNFFEVVKRVLELAAGVEVVVVDFRRLVTEYPGFLGLGRIVPQHRNGLIRTR